MTKKLFIDNLGWNKHRAEQMKLRLAFLVGKIDELVGLNNPIVINLQNSKDKEDDVNSQYYEGVINLYENTPDWRGDFLHELAHQFFRERDLSSGIKVKLAKIKRRLKREHGDGRVFIIEHTYKDNIEVLCTLFKWYILGKVIDDTYLIILKNYCMEGYLTIDKALSNGGEKMEKAQKMSVGMIRTRRGIRYQKIAVGKWRRVKKGMEKKVEEKEKWNERLKKERLYTFYHGTTKENYNKIKNEGTKVEFEKVSGEGQASAISFTQDYEMAKKYGDVVIKTTFHPMDFKKIVRFTLDNYETLLTLKEREKIEKLLNEIGGIKKIYEMFLNKRDFFGGEIAVPFNISSGRIIKEKQ